MLRRSETTGLLKSTEGLRKLILENPDLPLLVFAGEDANIGDYSYMSCSDIRAHVGEFLDCIHNVNDCKCYTDRDEFEEDVADIISYDFKGTKKEWDEYLSKVLAEYDPYWTECIILYVDN